ncbi:conserved hypothetical protein [Vibrio crassostreae]|uniref:hypothetical protein n=1 Tax=Vibrio crassostreae TaxID=246167 RepID=UPI0006313DE2|nr:hypothetical protein [Vibrio crassostreae]CAK2041409.1 conserved hypothetical protein [Vibrio crassostreae]CAK2044730.1 conserved hypothetical protein [Vibrio crassostreae]CAK2352920.1 conserved hypothetical protein [Vibrio crassostreae]CAK2819397.1 conserved hypothetical protein [Vibrio crassostreae]CAK2886646.1 conserved hypothetical protein [Vibrio crassostreae]
MDWSVNMGKLIRMILGVDVTTPQKRDFEITPKMVNPNVIRMDLSSFRKSDEVAAQAEAAEDNYKK